MTLRRRLARAFDSLRLGTLPQDQPDPWDQAPTPVGHWQCHCGVTIPVPAVLVAQLELDPTDVEAHQITCNKP